MAVNGFILDQYKNKKVGIILKDSTKLEGVLVKNGRRFYLEEKRLILSQIAAIKEEIKNEI